MRAYRMTGWGTQPQTTTAEVPSPGPGQILIRVAGCGLCRSDLTMPHIPRAAGEKMGWRMPFTLGHETAGWVAELGSGLRSSDLTLGEPVALVSPASCGECDFCLRGRDSNCMAGLSGRGYGRDGGLASFVLAAKRDVLKLGSLDPLTAGPLTDAGATAYHAVRRAIPRISPAGTVVVIGAGGLGAFAVQFLRALTAATVIAVDLLPARRSYASSVGAHTVSPDVPRRCGADAVLDFVGTDDTITAGLKAVRPGGAYGLIGSAGGTFTRPWFGALPRDGEVFTFQGSSIADAREVIALTQAGLIRNEVTLYPFDKITTAYEHLSAGTLPTRAVITMR
ncbi:propanol-preferring alcohol dehydrogenase [Actinoplanes lutulentus]|uniref:alcohol dehydrogenase n=1 Tax=Actinoplanes lutulentus TaxID=1287878 RepID=A0A327ZM84_9ACTN|nr:alcohol dehydrogenase catalytic domain-containing protein [Actinoplanes lutulentus]RAK43326.1 propanol-preferring alcohol dehydrogenase [Actinoplanes lutulentus]